LKQTSILKYIESEIRFQSSFVTYTGTHDSLLPGGGTPIQKRQGRTFKELKRRSDSNVTQQELSFRVLSLKKYDRKYLTIFSLSLSKTMKASVHVLF